MHVGAWCICRYLLSGLHPAFMESCRSLQVQLEDVISRAQQRPDNLQVFIIWQAGLQSRTLWQLQHESSRTCDTAEQRCGEPWCLERGMSSKGVEAASSSTVMADSTNAAPADNAASFHGPMCRQHVVGDSCMAGFVAEVDALRALLDLMRCALRLRIRSEVFPCSLAGLLCLFSRPFSVNLLACAASWTCQLHNVLAHKGVCSCSSTVLVLALKLLAKLHESMLLSLMICIPPRTGCSMWRLCVGHAV